ncbi:uncharacterized protein LOC132704799 isoform X2 [Cylas formicarius]|uniref:uncharacterized protein LOC132704799 isoform X2 n=1 Tax=Cylas formicarius TaxID=197179 RepID=UPI0029588F90|nr:uncharacterized protein LOC132704799 isoform X2 [Cylas formicarius]
MNSNFKMVDGKLVEKILEQGQKLRNAMVESILKNDPFSAELTSRKHYTTPRDSSLSVPKHADKIADSKLLEAYLNGDYLTREQETSAMETIRTMPVLELSNQTQKTLHNVGKICTCTTCLAYMDTNLNCDLRRNEGEIMKPCNNTNILKFVDSLKVILHGIQLNETGLKRISNKEQLQYSALNECYFLEYKVPDILTKKLKKSKVDSGLTNTSVRFCSRRVGEFIQLSQVFVHEISNLHELDLHKLEMCFKISCRSKMQKISEPFGVAKIFFSTIEQGENFSVTKNIPIYISEVSPIIVGHLKITIQLGSNRLYFGKEFVGAATLSNRHYETVHDICREWNDFKKPLPINNNEKLKTSSKGKKSLSDHNAETKATLPSRRSTYFDLNETDIDLKRVPLIYEENLLLQLRENFMVLEFWKRAEGADALFGITKVPLHQFYLAYRNRTILQHLTKNKLPVIGTDWWEPIYSIDNEEFIGQVQILIALGTEEQIENLETERGFKEDIVKARFASLPRANLSNGKNYFRDKVIVKKKLQDKSTNTCRSSNRDKSTVTKAVNTIGLRDNHKFNKCDIGIQSDIEVKMDGQKNQVSTTQDMLASFVSLLEQKRKPTCMESGTNTETMRQESNTAENVLKKNQFPNSLQNTLEVDVNLPEVKFASNYFKARVHIIGANQLPSRRRCKPKKSKHKTFKMDDNSLPSTYVTFEALPSATLHITPVITKSVAPMWNYECDVDLPAELLTNDQTKLIFKVWKKSSNVVLQPNMQTDVVVGFAALDLSVLLAGLPNVRGWFNIMDFSAKCNGQLNVHVTPLENLSKFGNGAIGSVSIAKATEIGDAVDRENEPLSRALKRKFIELDEITQRLRLRLSEVVSENPEDSNDDVVAEQFENDINTLCVEEDFDLVNFDDEARKGAYKKDDADFHILSLSSDSSDPIHRTGGGGGGSSSPPSDARLREGKQRIDVLLEKLTLISAETSRAFSDRYVSGCSAENVLKGLDHDSRPNITAGSNFDPSLFQQIYSDAASSTASQTSDSLDTAKVSGSVTSVATGFSDCRANPDGRGNGDED